MAEPKVRFKRADGSSFPEWGQGRFGDLIEAYNEKVSSDCILPVLTSSKTDGIQYQSDHFGREQLHDITGYNVIPRGYCTYRNRSDGTDFTFNINTLCDRGIVSKFYPVFRETDKCNLYFLMMLMNNELKTVRKIAMTAKGTGQKVLSFLDLQKIEIRIPCLEEQQKIADFLSSVDEVITASEEEVANLETQKKAVMKKIFSQEVRFKSADGSDFPEWEEKAIREFAQCIAGATPSTKVDEYWKNGTIPWMSSGEVNKGLIFETDSKITQLGYDNTSTKMVPAETVVMALAGQGKTRGMVALTKIELCTNQSLCSIITDDSVHSAYLYQYLITQYQNLRQVSSGDGTRGGLNLQLVGDYVVLIPSDEEQRLIADFLSDFDEAIADAKKELELWKELKKGLLQQMFV